MIQEVEKTEFHVEVVKLGAFEKHPNADTLSLTNINGYPVIARTGDFQEGSLAVYIPVDSVVNTTRPEFAFLMRNGKTLHRVKAMKLRGIFSMGLLIPAPEGVSEGQDVAELFGVLKYESVEERKQAALDARLQHIANARKAKKTLKLPVYGLDPLRKYSHILEEGEVVFVTEKIHGTNARFCFEKGQLWVGSHKVMRGASPTRLEEWLRSVKLKFQDFLGIKHRAHIVQEAGDVWWKCVEQYGLKEKLAKKPGFVLYGEIYGESVQDLTYDSPVGRKFRAFDVYNLNASRFLNYDEFLTFVQEIGLDATRDTVPVLRVGPWNEEMRNFVKTWPDNNKSTLNSKQLAEGVVVKPLVDRVDNRVGRVAMKFVGQTYLLRAEKEE